MTDNPCVFGKYDVIRRLAVGGMGEIFLAKQTGMAGFERLVILKSLLPQLAQDPDQLAQFLDEARIVGSINHPNVVACYEVGEWKGVYFIALEYINGVDVAMLLKAADDRGMRFPINVSLALVREAALGLDSAHHATDHLGRPLKIVHRDISPHNVMVRHDGLTKIVDFGVAMAANRSKRTEASVLKGKLGYMAPEQIKAQPIDGRADQFSLGVMLWEMLTQRRLFTAEDPSGVFMKIVRERVPPPSSVMPDVPPEIDAIVMKMTAQEPQDRFGRLAECAAALRKMLDLRGAHESETADLVRDLVGTQLQERLRDLTPVPVRILGVQQLDEQMSTTFCKSCGTQAVRGDRFCRSCGRPIGKTKSGTPQPPTSTPSAAALQAGAAQMFVSPPPVVMSATPFAGPIDDAFTEVAEDLIDVAFDDASGPAEASACVGMLELVDGVDVHEPPEATVRPLAAHFDEIAARLGGSAVTTKGKVVATFFGNGRAARFALAFARRAAALVARAHRNLRFRAGIAALPGLSHGENAARDEAERVLARTKRGMILISERARVLAAVAHRYGECIEIPAEGPHDALVAVEAPQARPIAGRAAERMLIEHAIAAADVAQAQQHLIVGDAGTGKSTLLEFVESEAHDRGFIVGRAQCARSCAVLRYDAVRQAIKSAALELNAISRFDGPWWRALDALSLRDGEKRLLRALVDDEAFQEDVIPLARRRLLLRAAIVSFFSTLAEKRGVCIVLDDVHNADASSTEVFAELGARLHGARFAIFAASRPSQGERVLPLAKRSILEPMLDEELTAVAALAVGRALPAHIGAHLARCSKGNPLFASLFARYLLESHLLRLEGAEVTASPELERLPAPPTILVLVFAWHALLPVEVREVLVAAASLGSLFDENEITALLQRNVSASLALAVQRRALKDEGGGRFSFPTLCEREGALARADPLKHAEFHRRVAALLESKADAHGVRPIEVEERMVHHYALAEDIKRAGASSERVANAWSRLGAADATLEHYRRALHVRWRSLGQNVDADRAAKALELAARATQTIGEIDPQASVDLALPLLRQIPENIAKVERAAALLARASSLLRLRRAEEALHLLDVALALQPPAAQRGALLIESAAAHEQLGDVAGAHDLLQQALAALADAPAADRGRAVDAMLALGRIHLRSRNFPKAREMLELGLAESRKRKNVGAELELLSILSTLEQSDKQGDRAVHTLQEAVQIAHRIGDGISEAKLRQQLARTLQQLGRKHDAIHAARDALLAAQRVSWDEGAAVAVQLVTALEQAPL